MQNYFNRKRSVSSTGRCTEEGVRWALTRNVLDSTVCTAALKTFLISARVVDQNVENVPWFVDLERILNLAVSGTAAIQARAV